jgi:lipid II:glycine glycyltransferase (peptidoglycan interpeptide bridge formation enzyme)
MVAEEAIYGNEGENFSSLFTLPNYLHTKDGNPHLVFCLYKKPAYTFVGRLFCVEQNEWLVSPIAGSFLQAEWEKGEHLTELILKCIEQATLRSLQGFRFILPPVPYLSEAIQHYLIDQLRSKVSKLTIDHQLSYYIPLLDSELKLASDQRRYVRKATEAKMCFQIEDIESLSEVYTLFEANRKKRDARLSMSEEALRNALTTFPSKYNLVCGRVNGDLACAALIIAVTDRVLYTFYTAHSQAYASTSPVVPLHYWLYGYAKGMGYKYLDLGTDGPPGAPEAGVRAFKLSLGAKEATKHTITIPV